MRRPRPAGQFCIRGAEASAEKAGTNGHSWLPTKPTASAQSAQGPARTPGGRRGSVQGPKLRVILCVRIGLCTKRWHSSTSRASSSEQTSKRSKSRQHNGALAHSSLRPHWRYSALGRSLVMKPPQCACAVVAVDSGARGSMSGSWLPCGDITRAAPGGVAGPAAASKPVFPDGKNPPGLVHHRPRTSQRSCAPKRLRRAVRSHVLTGRTSVMAIPRLGAKDSSPDSQPALQHVGTGQSYRTPDED